MTGDPAASARPFVDRPVTDRSAADSVAAGLAVTWELPAPRPLRAGMNVLYRCGHVVLRVGHATAPAAGAHELVAWLLEAGVPTVVPIPGLAADVDGLAVTGWRHVEAAPPPHDLRAVWRRIGAAVGLVHDLSPARVPAGYPTPDPAGFPWWDFPVMLDDVSSEVDDVALAALRATVERHADWADRIRHGRVLCHGDVHPGNVMVTVDGPLLVDWDLLCVAHPSWDHAMLTVAAERWGVDPVVHPAFLDGYGGSPDPDLAFALGELRNVAATLLRVRAGRHDPVAAAEAAHRLRYWRGETNEPFRAQ